ncbi:hypothetical protein CORC01_11584 [Colletotrichum orchidophilum]|uniref:Uncharacterized protein n=1 Tax=Colletotrichum orchidophilum TaxID=1209926 RepID=A0A1G4AVG4_9PEZI|nr:uncharacterized protein CORC01_11584 [Colletotrichum orchidophilum]OHE93095.1 hypothetical protein CORC01_11584 [Colletotrichum orchidophilum]
MPSATSTQLSQYVFSNLGPMTTVWTPPASCATPSPQLYLAFNDSATIYPQWLQKCETRDYGDCYPSGKAIDSAGSAASSANDLANAGTIYYFSPASACPQGYTTVGVAAKNGAGDVSSSGAFVPPVVTDPALAASLLPWNPPNNVLMEALEGGETAVVCCPEGYTADEAGGATCYSEVPSSLFGDPMTGCKYTRTVTGDRSYTFANATFTYNNTLVTAEVATYTGTYSEPSYSTVTKTIDSDVADLYIPVAARDAVTLVFRAADVTGSTTGSGAAGPTQTGSSSAAGLRVMTSGGRMGMVAAAWTFAAIVGVMLGMPQ